MAMKELPDEKELLELLEMARSAEEKAKKFAELAEAFSQKWESRLKDRQAAKQKVGGKE